MPCVASRYFRRSGFMSLATIRDGETAPAWRSPLIRAPAMLPAPRKPRVRVFIVVERDGTRPGARQEVGPNDPGVMRRGDASPPRAPRDPGHGGAWDRSSRLP